MMEVEVKTKDTKMKSKLMTPDPYHTPGYGGFCPQFKYQYGNTFGRTTCNLLQDNNIPSSGNLVLANIYPKPEEQKVMRIKSDQIKFRTHSWGDQKLLHTMVPGYTGFIPKSEHYYGKRYAENCVHAITSFEADQKGYKQKMQELQTIRELQTGRDPDQILVRPLPEILARLKLPLPAVARGASVFISKSTPPPALSPYSMKSQDPRKRFMSGYTGFLPRSRGLYGQGFPIVTNKALVDFASVQHQQKVSRNEPVQIDRVLKTDAPPAPLHPVDSGLVPKYTGHVPSEKFRYGQTFGMSTKNALQEKKMCQN